MPIQNQTAAAIQSQAQAQVKPAHPVQQAQSLQPPPATQPAQQGQPPTKKKGKWWIWLLVILGVIIVAGAVLYFLGILNF
mgnify:CR=1 FL=1